MQSQSTLCLHQNYKQKVKDTISHLAKENGSMIANNEDIATALGQFSKHHLVKRL